MVLYKQKGGKDGKHGKNKFKKYVSRRCNSRRQYPGSKRNPKRI